MLVKLKSPKLDRQHGKIQLIHGSGGKATTDLIQQLFLTYFHNPWLMQQHDSTCVPWSSNELVMSSDSFVVSPLFFPGGNIGDLAINGTVNDLVMSGAVPKYLSANFILEEGFSLRDLESIVKSMAEAALTAGVQIITGDTKVVEKAKGDGVYISTTGVGYKTPGITLHPSRVCPGDKIIINGAIAEHGIAVLTQREHLQLHTAIKSDTAALHELVQIMLSIGQSLHCLRDPTRGGVAATLNEIAQAANTGIFLYENSIPISEPVRGVCELFGLDPLHVANEGKLLAICAAELAETLLQKMQEHPLGKNSAIIGEVIDDANCFVQLKTNLGGDRIIDWIYGEQLPRIC